MVDRLFQIGLVMAHSLAAQETEDADLVIRPLLPTADRIGLEHRVALMATGDAAVRDALPSIRRLLAMPAQRRITSPDPRRCPPLSLARR